MKSAGSGIRGSVGVDGEEILESRLQLKKSTDIGSSSSPSYARWTFANAEEEEIEVSLRGVSIT